MNTKRELLIAKFRLKWKKVGKTARPFRYDLNQIPYDYTVEVRNRFTLGVPLEGTRRVGGLLGVAGRLSGTVSPFRAEQGTSLETP